MIAWFLRPVRQFAQTLIANETPRQIAWGFGLGMMAGLLPKANLLFVLLGIVICAFRVNRPASLLAMGLFSLVGPVTDGFAHQLGDSVLGWEPGQAFYEWLYALPLGPYLGFHNTVVMGQLLLGLYFFYPTYYVTRWVAARVQPPLRKWLLGYRVIRWLRGAEIGAHWGIES
jgi:uncharacterized protein (TIGR03546 family)